MKHHYLIRYKGDFFTIHPNGNITRDDMPGMTPSGDWKIAGVTFHHWARRLLCWEEIKPLLDKGDTVRGYIHDKDHGTLRGWMQEKATIQRVDPREMLSYLERR